MGLDSYNLLKKTVTNPITNVTTYYLCNWAEGDNIGGGVSLFIPITRVNPIYLSPHVYFKIIAMGFYTDEVTDTKARFVIDDNCDAIGSELHGAGYNHDLPIDMVDYGTGWRGTSLQDYFLRHPFLMQRPTQQGYPYLYWPTNTNGKNYHMTTIWLGKDTPWNYD